MPLRQAANYKLHSFLALHVPLFEELSPTLISKIVPRLKLIECTSRLELIRKDEAGRGLFVVFSGTLRSHPPASPTSYLPPPASNLPAPPMPARDTVPLAGECHCEIVDPADPSTRKCVKVVKPGARPVVSRTMELEFGVERSMAVRLGCRDGVRAGAR